MFDVTVQSARVAWTSPDAQVKIYEIIDPSGQKHQTKSHKIGNGVGQTFSVITEEKNGRIYIKLPPDEFGAAASQRQSAAPQPGQLNLGEFQQAVKYFVASVNKFSDAVNAMTPQQNAKPVQDFVPTESDLSELDDIFGGGEIVNDL